MTFLFSRTVLIVSATICALAITGCSPNLGAEATRAETIEFLSGNSVIIGDGGIYYSPDGSTKAVFPGGKNLSIGRWSFEFENVLCINERVYYLEDGKTVSDPGRYCVHYFIQPDGTAFTEEVFDGKVAGSRVLLVPAPVLGFVHEAKFNALRRSLGV